ncbi:non-ribosomal peptide synthetase [Streptomyces panaciradicis]|uniref:non-ribosomal peptide synthetase n=1 Tax=Streptomyces panaciradicis TaxID=1470261 RepID=UPI00201CC829|nr:amino acid adenylation domain-containing protein [Streptomyces panaciradicis]MCL6673355.1 amino acid adenylation domain-containing protein [Streptomyces panaciradicis]
MTALHLRQHTPAAHPEEHADVLPVTDAQRSLLFIQEAAARKDLYNNSFRIVFDSALDAEAMRSALERLVLVQPALRTVFRAGPEGPEARLAREVTLPWETAGHDGAAAWETWLDEQTEEFVRLPLDLSRAPLCRFRLLVSAPDAPARSALLVTVHHTVSDGVSVRVLVDEICAGYRQALGRAVADGQEDPAALARKRESSLRAELAAQCAAARTAVDAGEADTLAALLAGVAPTTLYPVPGRPQDTSHRAERLRLLLDRPQRTSVERAARNLGTTPYELLLACYALLLGDYAGSDDVLVGSPFATRRTVASHQLCGFFVNTLPMALPARDMPFEAHCREVSATVRETRARQSVPFDALVTRLAPERAGNRNPVFQCMFAMQDELRTRVALTPWSEGRIEILENGSAKFDLWLGATAVEDGLRIELDYDQDLLPESYARRFLAEYRELLLQAVETPSAGTGSLLAGLGARRGMMRRVLRRGADGRPDAPGGLLGLVREAARRHPDAVAVRQPSGSEVSYAELLRRTERTATGLAGRGVSRGDAVAVVPGDLVETVVAMLAVLWCGAAYLPLDTALPAERLTYMIEQSGCRLVIGLPGADADGPPRATPAQLEAEAGAADAPPAADGTDPVYIMFTSGSTGRPKGVHMGQGPLLNLLHWQLRELRMGPDSRFLQYAPLGFDVSYQEIFPTLACGGTVVGLGALDRRDLTAVARLAEQEELTHLYLPVAVAGAFAGAVESAGLSLPTVRHICVSGEQLNLDERLRRLLARDPERELVNLYGPTETTAVTWHVVRGDDLPAHDHVPVGRPVPGVDAYLLGPDGRDVPPGAVGELYLGGVCPAVGYVNDPEHTAAAFLPAPGAPEGSTARVYRTGDLALLAEHGALVFLGRRDAQVKVRGHRVELGELESAAERLPDVGEAVAAVTGTGEQAALCLFLRPTGPAQPKESAVRAHLEQILPSYMLPRYVRLIDAVPLTPNGKVDRTALTSALGAGRLRTAQPAEEGSGWEPAGTERMVRDLWTALLGTAPSGPDDSFFALGGNSFDVLKLIAALRENTDRAPTVSDFFRRPTVRALAAHLDGGA